MFTFTPATKMSPCCRCLTRRLLFPAMSSTTCLISRGAFLLLAAAVAVALPCAAALQELQLQDAVLIDDVVQEAAQAWYHGRHRRTGVTYPVSLPGSLSGVAADVARFRAGSLRRYGVRRFGEFAVPPGLAVRGQASHLLAVRANLGNLSSVFDEYAASGGYRIASPVLGLTFYGLARRGGTARLEVLVTAAAIRVNFSMAVPALQPGARAALHGPWRLNGSCHRDRRAGREQHLPRVGPGTLRARPGRSRRRRRRGGGGRRGEQVEAGALRGGARRGRHGAPGAGPGGGAEHPAAQVGGGGDGAAGVRGGGVARVHGRARPRAVGGRVAHHAGRPRE
ncbi:Os04g0580500 [Oryza sativa Japonica Group]|uniref:OSJNBa0064M23.10 protein n=1 Tax=Oryza sativa subsp. japonica TaxID=39947 RepID=Q7XUN3_ORYSJ|nr:Os04g0580500 [Oryza sativa Japonica Group]CAD41165.2 OSJNBa0064M23.10 [Oryza sativa Japonica Group]|eukprot:NP_001053648.1 Os04g0580500 [Oryza sativa Japonica Group]